MHCAPNVRNVRGRREMLTRRLPKACRKVNWFDKCYSPLRCRRRQQSTTKLPSQQTGIFAHLHTDMYVYDTKNIQAHRRNRLQPERQRILSHYVRIRESVKHTHKQTHDNDKMCQLISFNICFLFAEDNIRKFHGTNTRRNTHDKRGPSPITRPLTPEEVDFSIWSVISSHLSCSTLTTHNIHPCNWSKHSKCVFLHFTNFSEKLWLNNGQIPILCIYYFDCAFWFCVVEMCCHSKNCRLFCHFYLYVFQKFQEKFGESLRTSAQTDFLLRLAEMLGGTRKIHIEFSAFGKCQQREWCVCVWVRTAGGVSSYVLGMNACAQRLTWVWYAKLCSLWFDLFCWDAWVCGVVCMCAKELYGISRLHGTHTHICVVHTHTRYPQWRHTSFFGACACLVCV